MDAAFHPKPQLPGCLRRLAIQPELFSNLFYAAIIQGCAELDLFCHYAASVDISSTLKLIHGP